MILLYIGQMTSIGTATAQSRAVFAGKLTRCHVNYFMRLLRERAFLMWHEMYLFLYA